MKKFLSVVIAVIIIAGVVPCATITAGAYYTYTSGKWEYIMNNDGETITITGYKDTSATSLTFPGTLDGKKVTGVGDKSENDFFSSNLKTIKIPDSVDKIYGYGGAFQYTAWFEKQPNGVVYAGKVAYAYKGTAPAGTKITLKKGTKGIADNAFFDQKGIESIKIPDGVTNIGRRAFQNCTSLKTVNIPDSVTNIGRDAFTGTALYNSQNGTVYAGKWVVGTFEYTKKDVIIESGTVGIAGGVFVDKKDMESVTIPNSVKYIGHGAFARCNKLNSITLPNGIKRIGDFTFEDCAFTSLILPDSLTSIGNRAFQNCGCLTSLKIPKNVTVIGECAFFNCVSLKSVTISSGVKIINKGTFYHTGLTSVTIPANVKIIESDFDFSAFGYCTNLKSVTFKSKTPPTIGPAAFYDTPLTIYVPKGSKAAYKKVDALKMYTIKEK